jgi:hypothetical protein
MKEGGRREEIGLKKEVGKSLSEVRLSFDLTS